jgi:hypothetical protein
MWLNAYKNDYKGVRLFANYNSFPGIVSEDVRKYLTRTYNYINDIEKKSAINSIVDGIKIFKNTFNFMPKVFMAPAYCWSSEIERTLNNNGIKYIQSGRAHFIPNYYGKKFKYIRHYTGEMNKYNQLYTVRNVIFEPTLKNHNEESVSKALKEIKTAFFWNKPVIIQSHRLNYMGSKYESNRTVNLNLLSELLNSIVKSYSDVEFMSSLELFKLIETKQIQSF